LELAVAGKLFKRKTAVKSFKQCKEGRFNLTDADTNLPYTIKEINTDDQAVKDFLFTLGCYEGEMVTVISALAQNFVIHVKGARYSIDEDLARAIIL
jgi:ferrous iron transport protein A